MRVKRLNPAISPCARCGVAADEQCVSLRTGKPIKYDHPGGRAVVLPVLPVLTADQLLGFGIWVLPHGANPRLHAVHQRPLRRGTGGAPKARMKKVKAPTPAEGVTARIHG